MKTWIERDTHTREPFLECWECPDCKQVFKRIMTYGRQHWVMALHHHLSHHFTPEQLERLVTLPAARAVIT